MFLNYLAVICGGIGPDVWDKEVDITATDFLDATQQAQAKADECGGRVVSVEQLD